MTILLHRSLRPEEEVEVREVAEDPEVVAAEEKQARKILPL